MTSGTLRAHFIWVIPAGKGDSAVVVVSDSPQPDDDRLLRNVLRQIDGRVENLIWEGRGVRVR
jgi:hypothetical protein